MEKNVTTTLRAESPCVLDWPRWSSYEVREQYRRTPTGDQVTERWIYPVGEPLEARHFTQDVDLVNPFAELALVPKSEQEQRLLGFIREFGLLGQSVLAGRARRIAGAPPVVIPPKAVSVIDPLSTKKQRRLTPLHVDAPRMADELSWALAHVRNVDLIMRLHHARRAELDELLGSLYERTLRVRALGGESARLETRPRTLNVPQLAEPWMIYVRPTDLREPHDQPLAISRRIIGALLRPNLFDAPSPRDYDVATGLPTFRFRTLVQMLYWQLADRLGHWSVRQCRCGVMFFADHGNTESHSRQCFRRFYMRDHRKGDLRRKRARGKKRPKR